MPSNITPIQPDQQTSWDRAFQERNWLIFGLHQREGQKVGKFPTDLIPSEYWEERVRFDAPVSVVYAAHYTYAEAVHLVQTLQPCGKAEGYAIGYLPRPDSVLTIGDLDNCRDPVTGNIEPWALEVLGAAKTYAEVSASGTGIRLLMERMEGDDQHKSGERNCAGFFANGTRGAVLTFAPLPGYELPPQCAPAVRDAILKRRGVMKSKGEAQSITDPVPPELVRLFLEALPNNDLEYDPWLEIGYAVKASLGNAGADLFAQWSARAPKNNPEFTMKTYLGLDPEDITFGTLHEAVRAAFGGQLPPQLGVAMGQRRFERAAAQMRPVSGSEGDPWADIPDWDMDGVLVPDLIDACDLAQHTPKPREWTVADLVPRKHVTLLTGNGGVGKSLLALQLATCIATGLPWVGQNVSVGGALFISVEDDMDELHRRMVDISAGLGINLGMVGNLRIWSLMGQEAVMAKTGFDGIVQPMPLFHRIREQAMQVQPEVIVLDTLADLFAGDENSRSEGTQFVQLLIGMAKEFNCAVILLAHPSKSGMASGDGTSGSTSWHNKVRSRLYLTREAAPDGMEPDPKSRVVEHMKANYGSDDHRLRIRWDGGMFHPSGAPQIAEDNEAMILWEAEFMRMLDERNGQQRYVSASPSMIYAPKVFADAGNGITKKQFQIAMDRLFNKGVIEIQEITNSDYKRRSYIFRKLS